MVRALIATYILSGILLVVLSFALFKFRLPENQVNLAVCAVYILSCFSGRRNLKRAKDSIARRIPERI